MTLNLKNHVFYQFHQNTWIQTEKLKKSEIGLIFDKDKDIIYYVESKNATAKDQSNAKKSLLQKKIKYPNLKFRPIEYQDIVKQ